MKRILLTGGGTGGHFYPLLAVAEELERKGKGSIELTYMGAIGTYREEFAERGIRTYPIASSKLRRYFSLLNFLDFFTFFTSLFQSVFRMYFLMPDLVFSKGGPGALPVVLAARFYFIPVVIHESDSVPSLTTKITAFFAKKVLISFQETAPFFLSSKVVLTGNPLRAQLLLFDVTPEEAKQRIGLLRTLPALVVLGGSQGSERVNTFIAEYLAELLGSVQIYHQIGARTFPSYSLTVGASLKTLDPELRSRYHPHETLSVEDMRFALRAADVVFSRAGAGAIFEIAAFGVPSMLIPLDESANNHQRMNAYAYTQAGAARIIEEANLGIHLFSTQLKKILEDESVRTGMSMAALQFARPQAAEVVADVILTAVYGGLS